MAVSFGICSISVIPLRAIPDERSEMVSQLLFGESYEVLEVTSKWIFIRCSLDGYEGWISSNQHCEIGADYIKKSSVSDAYVNLGRIDELIIGSNESLMISYASTLPHFDGDHVYIQENKMRFLGTAQSVDGSGKVFNPKEVAQKLTGIPYVWGGRSVFGFDCSGLVQIIFKTCGLNLPRDASLQAEKGITIDFLEGAKPGDLVFLNQKDEEHISHVGMLVDQDHIFHASGKTRIDKIDHHGIFNEEIKRYTHKLRIIKRFINN